VRGKRLFLKLSGALDSKNYEYPISNTEYPMTKKRKFDLQERFIGYVLEGLGFASGKRRFARLGRDRNQEFCNYLDYEQFTHSK
jgi:hypothetical protein